MIVTSIVDKGDRLEVTFDKGCPMDVSKNPNNAVRKKIQKDYPELYPLDKTQMVVKSKVHLPFDQLTEEILIN